MEFKLKKRYEENIYKKRWAFGGSSKTLNFSIKIFNLFAIILKVAKEFNNDFAIYILCQRN